MRLPVAFSVATLAIIGLTALSAWGGDALAPDHLEFFEKQIRPVLVERCYECHNSVTKKKGGLALDWRGAMLAGGDSGPAIVPGKPAESLLVRAIRHEDQKLRMPKAGPKLSDETVRDFEAWIRMGAPDPRDKAPSADEIAKSTSWESIRDQRMQWWSSRPIVRPAISAVRDARWSDHPVDRFILARLESAGLQPAADADRRTLLRRVTYSLIGLPPTASEIDAFVKDPSPGAYEKVVDRLLASPRFGECWARHWMDWVRYADSHGSEGDPPVPYMWRYRDYLIRALNADIPYDRMVREHLAGDIMPHPRMDPASGINESALAVAQYRMVQHGYAPTDAMEEQINFTDNQIDVISKAFLGLTVSCARCHNHKFDPISQADFYALYGIMVSARPGLITVDTPARDAQRRLAMGALKKQIRDQLAQAWLKAAQEFPATLINAPEPGRIKAAAPKPAKTPKKKVPDPPPVISGWQAAIDESAAIGPRSPLHVWLRLHHLKDEALRAEWRKMARPADEKTVGGVSPTWDLGHGDYRKWFHHGTGLPADIAMVGAFSIEARGDRILDNLFPAGAYSHLLSSKDSAILHSPRFKIESDEIFVRLAGVDGARFRFVVDNYPRADGPIYPSVSPADGELRWYSTKTTYWKGEWVYLEVATAGDLATGAQDPEGRSWFGITQVSGHDKGQPFPREPERRLPGMSADMPPGDARELAERYGKALRESIEAWRDGRMTDEQAEFVGYFVHRDLLPNTLAALPDAAKLIAEYRKLEAELATPTRSPGVLEAAGFDQPLFIRGDHKHQGPPVPRRFLEAIDPNLYRAADSGRLQLADSIFSLKDPLPARVIANRIWKNIFGEGIVTTVDNFGRLGQQPTHPELLDYLASDMIEHGWSLKHAIRLLVTSRTYRLSSDPPADVAGRDPNNQLLSHYPVRRLDAEAIRDSLLAVSGHLNTEMYGPTVGGGSNRRSVYVGVFRGHLDPFLAVFDAPQPFTTQGRREVTNVPAQSLTMLNDPIVIAHAKHWATCLVNDPAATDEKSRIIRMFVTALGREPGREELEQVRAYLRSDSLSYGLAPDASLRDIRPWSDLALSLFNVKEFIYLR